jgi:hypothetical protein
MNIPREKARAVIDDYMKSGNAYKTLLKHGYSEMTSMKASKQILNNCYKKVLKDAYQSKELVNPKEIQSSLEVLGITREEVASKLKEIALNDKDYTNALKVLSILAKDIGINFTDDQAKPQPISITLEETVKVRDITPE